MEFFTGHDPEADVDYLLTASGGVLHLMVRDRKHKPDELGWSSPVLLAAVDVPR